MAREVCGMRRLFYFILIFLFLTTPNSHHQECFAGQTPKTESLSGDLDSREIISIEELQELMNKKANILLFDARGKAAYDQGHIEGATLPMPLAYYQEKQLLAAGVIGKPFDVDGSLSDKMKDTPKESLIVAYCNSNCSASVNLLRRLQRLGFTSVRSMEEGYQAWEKAGHPVVIGAPRLASEALQEN